MTNKFLQFLGLTKRSGNLIEGYNKCEEFIKKGKKLYCIVMSNDVSENTKKKFLNYCREYNIPIINEYTKSQLGNILGMSEINIIGVCNKGMSNKLIELWKQEKES